MKNPTSVTIDRAVNAGYVAYRLLRDGEHSVHNDRVSQDVVADYDADSQVIGIELLALNNEALEVARHFAATRGLAFPDLKGELVSA